MALHCFNLFFPCTNILQVKYADLHRRSLHCTLKVAAKFATISRQERRYVCEMFAGPAVCGHSGGRGGGTEYVRPISSHSYWLECWQCRQECGDRSTLSHTHTPAEERASLSQTQLTMDWWGRLLCKYSQTALKMFLVHIGNCQTKIFRKTWKW